MKCLLCTHKVFVHFIMTLNRICLHNCSGIEYKPGRLFGQRPIAVSFCLARQLYRGYQACGQGCLVGILLSLADFGAARTKQPAVNRVRKSIR